jgi:ferrous iron transport protein A
MKKGEKGMIEDFDIEVIPLKLVEMGCLPGNIVEVLQFAPWSFSISMTVIWPSEWKRLN